MENKFAIFFIKKMIMNFIIFLIEDFYPRYGFMDEAGNWNGMIGEIIRGVRQ